MQKTFMFGWSMGGEVRFLDLVHHALSCMYLPLLDLSCLPDNYTGTVIAIYSIWHYWKILIQMLCYKCENRGKVLEKGNG